MAEPSYPGEQPVSAETRERETEAAMQVLGCSWEQWPFSDCEPDWDGVREKMLFLKRQRLPSLVFAPLPEPDGHEQHSMVGRLAGKVFGERVSYYLTYQRYGRSNGTRPVPFEREWIALKHRALACYESQSAHPATYLHFTRDLMEYVQ